MNANPQPRLRLWSADYRWHGSWGAFQDYSAVVLAETKKAALGWLLMEYADTGGVDWTLTEIDLDKAGVTRISERSS